MKVLYVPLFRAAVSYVVSEGRRWSVLEQMLLTELATERHTLLELGYLTSLPERLVVEALINLLRAGWIEVRSTAEHAVFTATASGKRNAAKDELQPILRREIKWISLCMDRLTGAWMRWDDLSLVYDRDLPEGANCVNPVRSTLNYDDPGVRDLINLGATEGFEGFQPAARAPSRPYAQVFVTHGEVSSGLPDYAPLALREAILAAARDLSDVEEDSPAGDVWGSQPARLLIDDIGDQDLIVGGPAHRELVRSSLRAALSNVVIHSCFLEPDTIRELLPDFETAARRGVSIDLLWGLHSDPDTEASPSAVSESRAVLETLGPAAKGRVQLSTRSSGSHCKVLVHDDPQTGGWVTNIGSCNFLGTLWKPVEVSVRARNPTLGAQVMSHLISAQIPPSGEWPRVVHRLNDVWSAMRRTAERWQPRGSHYLRLMADGDHYACVTFARDKARRDIVLGCDLFGLTAETSALVPLERAAELGRDVRLYYRRASRGMKRDGKEPDAADLGRRRLSLLRVDGLHGKFLAWDDEAVAITSFNWLATAAGTRGRGAELGVVVFGPGLRTLLTRMMAEASSGAIDLTPRTVAARRQLP